MKFDVIVLPIIEWDHRFQRPQQLASAFAADGHRVYYARLHFAGWDASWSVEPIARNISRVSLPGPPDHNRLLKLPDAAVSLCADALLDLAKHQHINEAIILVQQPFWANVALRLAATTGWKVVYDCMDDHEGLTALDADIVLDEKFLADRADLVVSTSRKLASKHAATARRHILIPNACEFEHFARHENTDDPLPAIAGPIIGYYGAIMEWFDVEMIHSAAVMRPDWNFVLIGAVEIDNAESLRMLSNVHFPGEIAYADLPPFLHRFDVALIPFRLIPIIQAANPVKLYEYLSAGKPVVASTLPELEPFPELYELANTGQELVATAARMMAENSDAKVSLRVEWARQQTWNARYAALEREVAALWGKASIVIVSYQNLDRIKDCVHSIVDHTAYPNYEVIVVDNASDIEVVEFLRSFCADHSNFKLIESPQNLGFANCNNCGLAATAADSAYVVLLNNDTVVSEGWLQGLVLRLQDPTIGLVGPVTCPNGAANEAAVGVSYSDMDGMHEFAAKRAQEFRGRSFDIPMLAFFCVAMRRDVSTSIGPLDEAYGMGMFEDDDYAMRVRQAGLRVVCALDVFIHHIGLSSFGKLQKDTYSELLQTNQRYYERKWGIAWRAPAARPDIAGLFAVDSGIPGYREPRPPARSVSVILLNYNGLSHLDACLRSLASLNYPRHLLEIILLDNDSRDGSQAWLKEHWPGVALVENDQNLGFSRACNQGARIAKGELIAFLNNDARADPEWLNGLLATMARDETIACVGSMIMTWDGTEVEFAGRFDDVFCIAYEPLRQTLRPEAPETYSLFVSGGAMLMDRNTFLQVGGFDQRYFMYHEDVDLCWRLWTLGRRCAIAPNSVIYHRGGASSKKLQSKVVQGWAQKHLLWTALKNFDDSNLRECLPMLIYYLVERGRWSEVCMAGLIDVFEETLAALSSILGDRKVIQDCRQVSDETIFSQCGHPLAFILRIPLFGLMTESLKAAHSPDLVDFADPRQVFDAMLHWLRSAMSLRQQFAAVWQSDASDKQRRAQTFLQRSDDLNLGGEARHPDSPNLSEFVVEEDDHDLLGRLDRLHRAIHGYLLRS